MAFSKKGNINPEEWLKEEASWQLRKIIDALNAAHTMPFHCEWIESMLGNNYIEMLKEMEYGALAKSDQEITDAASNVLKASPLPIFVG